MIEPVDDRRTLRTAVYALLIALSVGQMLGRILAVNSVDMVGLEKNLVEKELAKQKAEAQADGKPFDEAATTLALREKLRKQRPFLSANDRSRWANVRSLVEHGTYEIDAIVAEPLWDTIDIVRHRGPDGELHFYSSKPPLLATLLAGPYWLIHKTTGATLGTHPYEIGRAMLVLVNVVPLVLAWVLLARLVERLGATDWGRIVVMAAATFGTFLTTFAVSLNNHIIAAVSALVAVYCAVRIVYDGQRRWRYFGVAGAAAAFAYSHELPALALVAALGVGLAYHAPRQAAAYLAGVLVVAAGHFGTNYLAHDSFREPYAHRSDTEPEDNWYVYKYVKDGKERSSYWSDPVGIDRGEPSAAAYALHATVGHHGIFSLTPIWLLVPASWLLAWRRGQQRQLVALVAVLSLLCLAFYLARPQLDRNYGGMTSGLRWMFWFAPLWLATMLPAVDWLGERRWGRALTLALLAVSALSAAYPTWNPWTHPWLTNWMLYEQWIRF